MSEDVIIGVQSFPKWTFHMLRCQTHAQPFLREVMQGELVKIVDAGTWMDEHILTSQQDVGVTVKGYSKKVLNFCSNNYLGFSNHPEVISAGKEALDKYGSGLSSVRFICGTQDIHKELEDKIARFHGRQDAILYPSCFDANAGLFEALLTEKDAVISDELNHASIIDGIRLCKARKHRFKHMDMKDLEMKLRECSDARLKLIATDGVFSMDGDVAPLPEIVKLANSYKAVVFVDECHATGVFGKSGRGTEEHFDLYPHIDIINSTLGKALGGAAGGYTTGPKEIIDLLRQRARPYLFSNSLPPAVVGAANKVMDMLLINSLLPRRVASNCEYFRYRMTKAGFQVMGASHPICPILIGDAQLANTFAKEMIDSGIYVVAFSYPVVPKNKARVCVQISASHMESDIDYAVNCFVNAGKKLKLIE